LKRRDVLIGALAAAVTPCAAAAQEQAKIYRLGILSRSSGRGPGLNAFEVALADLGYQENRNLVIERRYAAGDLNKLKVLAADLVRANVDVIVAWATPAALAAKQATATIPIVMMFVGDPVGSRLVASLAHPGGNATGLSGLYSLIDGKKVELLHRLKPDARRVAYAGNDQIVAEQTGFREAQTAAAALGMDAIFVNAPVPEAFEQAFATIAAAGAGVVIVPPSPPNTEARSRIVAAAAQYHLPAAYGTRAFADAGGLISYGPSNISLLARAAVFVDKILKGANPADLPVEQPTKFELVINLKTAKALGITVPPSIMVLADEVIE
jgi:putative ABC transport system substrate-binding protein